MIARDYVGIAIVSLSMIYIHVFTNNKQKIIVKIRNCQTSAHVLPSDWQMVFLRDLFWNKNKPTNSSTLLQNHEKHLTKSSSLVTKNMFRGFDANEVFIVEMF